MKGIKEVAEANQKVSVAGNPSQQGLHNPAELFPFSTGLAQKVAFFFF